MPNENKQPNEEQKKRISLHKNSSGEVSPYIIHLSHEQATITREPASPNLDALAEQLTIDEIEDEPMPEDESLSLDFHEIVHQLQESDYNLDPQAAKTKINTETPKPDQPLEAPKLITTASLEAIIAEDERPESITTSQKNNESSIQETKRSKRLRLPSFSLPRLGSPKIRAAAAFVAMSFAFVVPLHAIQQVNETKTAQTKITDAGRSAIDNFMRGAQALEGERLDVAGVDFERALDEFSEAEASLDNLNASVTAIANVIPQTDRTYESARGLITAGKELSAAASELASAGQELKGRESLTATAKLRLLSSYVQDALPHIETASNAIARVDERVIPDEYKEATSGLKTRVPELTNSMQEFVRFSDALVTIMGGEQKMRYLVIFQNNTELRPTGGFPGSFAEIDVLNGKIEQVNIPAGGTYDVQGQLSAFVQSPKPLALINPRWEFHDANWFPDFPTSAKKMLWFYEEAGGPTVDGVLAVNATMMPKLLELTGPIEMPEYGRTIDSENFLFETQKIVEFEYEDYQTSDPDREEDAPKQFIGDLAPKLLEHLEGADMQTTLSMLDLLGEGLSEKDVLLYFEDNALQANMEELGWSGSVKETSGDYLMVVNTNLGGGKTDTIIDQGVDLHSEIQPDGTIINTVTITKEHKGLQSALFESANNVDYLRLYVPKGSELISAEGFEIPDDTLFENPEEGLAIDEDYALLATNQRIHEQSKTDVWEESGKTVFGNWVQTKPGEIERVEFTYRLPIRLTSQAREFTVLDIAKSKLGFKDLESHTILIQKQPGVISRETNVSVSFPEQKSLLWNSHSGETGGRNIKLQNSQDHFIRFLLENEVK